MTLREAIANTEKPIALVNGATGGIGLAIVKALLRQPHWAAIFALSRSAQSNNALLALADLDKRLCVLSTDLSNSQDQENLGRNIEAVDGQLVYICNCVGMLHEKNIFPEKRLEDCTQQAMHSAFNTNALIPLFLIQALVNYIPRNIPSLFVSFSARVGSISDNRLGGWYAYRTSKAAHNMLIRTLAVELSRRRPYLTIIAYHPGTADSALSRPFQKNVPSEKLFSCDQAASYFLSVTDKLTEQDTGSFFAWDGSTIPW